MYLLSKMQWKVSAKKYLETASDLNSVTSSICLQIHLVLHEQSTQTHLGAQQVVVAGIGCAKVGATIAMIVQQAAIRFASWAKVLFNFPQ